jgi:hypothetical protein
MVTQPRRRSGLQWGQSLTCSNQKVVLALRPETAIICEHYLRQPLITGVANDAKQLNDFDLWGGCRLGKSKVRSCMRLGVPLLRFTSPLSQHGCEGAATRDYQT